MVFMEKYNVEKKKGYFSVDRVRSVSFSGLNSMPHGLRPFICFIIYSSSLVLCLCCPIPKII